MTAPIVRRLQGATRKQWELFDRAAVLDGYRTTSRWIRDVVVVFAKRARYRVEVRNGEGVWVPFKGLHALSGDASVAVLAVLEQLRVEARRKEV